MQPVSPLALQVLNTLERAGFEAYLVGGCVRDLLLGRPVHDWDMTTAALPEQVQALFEKTVPTGIRHGTVTVLLGGESFEVTTFRCDGDYSDSRRPDAVQFVRSLSEDLARRDFTVNAMAMDARGALTDLFGGAKDLQCRTLRCVGAPELRFQEDALRMLRAVRFCAQLGFTMERSTADALLRLAPRCAQLSLERIRDELEKTLLSPAPEEVGRMIASGLLAHLGLTDAPDLSALRRVPAERLPRWAMAKRLIPALDLTALRLEKRAVRLCEAAAEIQFFSFPECKRAIAAHGWEAVQLAASLCAQQETVQQIAATGDCVTLAQLAVRGSDLPWLHGPDVSAALQKLLEHVLEHPEDNQKELLLSMIK